MSTTIDEKQSSYNGKPLPSDYRFPLPNVIVTHILSFIPLTVGPGSYDKSCVGVCQQWLAAARQVPRPSIEWTIQRVQCVPRGEKKNNPSRISRKLADLSPITLIMRKYPNAINAISFEAFTLPYDSITQLLDKYPLILTKLESLTINQFPRHDHGGFEAGRLDGSIMKRLINAINDVRHGNGILDSIRFDDEDDINVAKQLAKIAQGLLRPYHDHDGKIKKETVDNDEPFSSSSLSSGFPSVLYNDGKASKCKSCDKWTWRISCDCDTDEHCYICCMDNEVGRCGIIMHHHLFYTSISIYLSSLIWRWCCK
jgi:hypothetical protein